MERSARWWSARPKLGGRVREVWTQSAGKAAGRGHARPGAGVPSHVGGGANHGACARKTAACCGRVLRPRMSALARAVCRGARAGQRSIWVMIAWAPASQCVGRALSCGKAGAGSAPARARGAHNCPCSRPMWTCRGGRPCSSSCDRWPSRRASTCRCCRQRRGCRLCPPGRCLRGLRREAPGARGTRGRWRPWLAGLARAQRSEAAHWSKYQPRAGTGRRAGGTLGVQPQGQRGVRAGGTGVGALVQDRVRNQGGGDSAGAASLLLAQLHAAPQGLEDAVTADHRRSSPSQRAQRSCPAVTRQRRTSWPQWRNGSDPQTPRTATPPCAVPGPLMPRLQWRGVSLAVPRRVRSAGMRTAPCPVRQAVCYAVARGTHQQCRRRNWSRLWCLRGVQTSTVVGTWSAKWPCMVWRRRKWMARPQQAHRHMALQAAQAGLWRALIQHALVVVAQRCVAAKLVHDAHPLHPGHQHGCLLLWISQAMHGLSLAPAHAPRSTALTWGAADTVRRRYLGVASGAPLANRADLARCATVARDAHCGDKGVRCEGPSRREHEVHWFKSVWWV